LQRFTGKKLNVAVVGLGKMGLLHTSLLSVQPNVQIVALCDKSYLMRKFAKSTLKTPLVTDKLSELANLDLDAAFVTTPIPSHYSIVKEIYENDIASNLFVEKTLSSNFVQSEELSNLSRKSKGITMVGYMKRFSVTFKKAKELLEEKILGALTSFDAYAYSSDFVDVKQHSSGSSGRGGVLEDLGSHVADLALWFFGDLEVQSARTQSSISPDSADSASFEVIGSNGLEGKFDVSWVKAGYRMPEFGLAIKGENGSIMVDDSELKLELQKTQPTCLYRQNLGDQVLFLLGDPEYFREDKHFVDSIANIHHPETNFQAAMKTDFLLEEVRRKSNVQ
jgi:predicted dehydrogenase